MVSKEPLISIIIPVFGVELYIEGCLLSITQQTYKNFEVILIDDGCLDKSVLIACTILERNNIEYKVIKQKNQGQGIARDTGVRNCNGEWVVFIDADDTIAPCFLEILLQQALTSQSVVSMSTYRMVDLENRFNFSFANSTFQIITQEEALLLFLKRKIPIILPAMLISKSFLQENKITSRSGCRFSEDVYVMWQIIYCANNISFVNMQLYNYLLRPDSTMTASKKEQILSGYTAFQNIEHVLDSKRALKDGHTRELLKRFLLPRWVLGALRTTAKISLYDDFIFVAHGMYFIKSMKALISFPDYRVMLLSQILRLCPKCFYIISRL